MYSRRGAQSNSRSRRQPSKFNCCTDARATHASSRLLHISVRVRGAATKKRFDYNADALIRLGYARM